MATVLEKEETHRLESDQDVAAARRLVRQAASAMGFSLVDTTKLVTAVSELARNAVIHAGGGSMRLEQLRAGLRQGLRLTFEDEGPGLPDVDLAMKDGYTTGGGLGLGLGGSRRLVNEFDIQSKPGEGTRIAITRWK